MVPLAMVVGAKAQITRAVNKIELALVLDTTGSMSGARLTSLKTAATEWHLRKNQGGAAAHVNANGQHLF